MKKRAFSLIELSIVILIIGILVTGVTQGSRLISQSRLQNARNLTRSSPVASIKDLAVWFEASSEASFSDSEQEDEAEISSWNDINPQSTFKVNATNSVLIEKPLYVENCINSIPCVRFNGTKSTLRLEETSFLNGSDYSIFVVEKKANTEEGMFLAGTGGAQENLHVGYLIHTTIRHAHFGDAAVNDATVPNLTTPTSRIHTFLFSQIAVNGNNKFYQLNGGADNSLVDPTSPLIPGAATSLDSAPILSWDGAAIGSHPAAITYYGGDIAEIIIFSRRIKTKEVDDIREYLSKKYDISLE